jgi:hypothetical protein
MLSILHNWWGQHTNLGTGLSKVRDHFRPNLVSLYPMVQKIFKDFQFCNTNRENYFIYCCPLKLCFYKRSFILTLTFPIHFQFCNTNQKPWQQYWMYGKVTGHYYTVSVVPASTISNIATYFTNIAKDFTNHRHRNRLHQSQTLQETSPITNCHIWFNHNLITFQSSSESAKLMRQRKLL